MKDPEVKPTRAYVPKQTDATNQDALDQIPENEEDVIPSYRSLNNKDQGSSPSLLAKPLFNDPSLKGKEVLSNLLCNKVMIMQAVLRRQIA